MPASTRFIYLLLCEGFYKIGVATDLKSRINNLQTGNPYPILLIHFWRSAKAPQTERILHRYYQVYQISPDREWFRLPQNEIHQLVSVPDIDAWSDHVLQSRIKYRNAQTTNILSLIPKA